MYTKFTYKSVRVTAELRLDGDLAIWRFGDNPRRHHRVAPTWIAMAIWRYGDMAIGIAATRLLHRMAIWRSAGNARLNVNLT